MAVRDRIKELRRVRASELKANPKNWRTHPADQRTALSRILEKIGWAGAVLARETPDGLELIDGHLRAELSPDEMVPVLVTDLDDDESATMLLAADPIAMMAQADEEALAALMADADPEVLAPLEPFLSKLLLQAEDFQPVRVPKESVAAPDESQEYQCPMCGHAWSGPAKPIPSQAAAE